MRYLLLLLLTPMLAFASCEEKLAEHFAVYEAEAARVYVNAPKMTLEIRKMSGRLGGLTYIWEDHVILSPALCEYDDLIMDSIIMHEIGHVIAHVYYPRLKAGPLHEALADQYGARLWNKSDALLEKLDERCAIGDNWSCNKRISWAWGMTH